eukprot:CAMPEP_0205819808 /NCGR_PEP_ID=MMETSP0206-20130828/2277_1 /ASSEMBLY_ACC=CAM_ASM_000279 /TAXON_ID=36767 /ORGANISM="Euplotes focardii, Strain TN1" /LENGTH=123 /DNA_ID=CAMNT_0053113787 /DNA_START=48 /DNA_END=419 /DNA_ORIENTATION=-
MSNSPFQRPKASSTRVPKFAILNKNMEGQSKLKSYTLKNGAKLKKPKSAYLEVPSLNFNCERTKSNSSRVSSKINNDISSLLKQAIRKRSMVDEGKSTPKTPITKGDGFSRTISMGDVSSVQY